MSASDVLLGELFASIAYPETPEERDAAEHSIRHMIKPRTITTAEELDGLADGTVVLDGQGEVARKLRGSWRVLIAESGWDAWLTESMEETYLPATVLHEPEAAA